MRSKSPREILASIKGSTKAVLWERVTGIPEFNPIDHSDGCSGGMSATYAKVYKLLPGVFAAELPWRDCCVIHDKAYYYGGSPEEKQAADEALHQCVAQTLGDSAFGDFMGRAMKDAVTIGGLPQFTTSYRWGYGVDFRDTV